MVVPKTDGGKSLLQVCIENENTANGTWQLESLMKCILQHKDVDPNLLDFSDQYTLLSYSYHNKKHKAFNMILEECQKKLDID